MSIFKSDRIVKMIRGGRSFLISKYIQIQPTIMEDPASENQTLYLASILSKLMISILSIEDAERFDVLYTWASVIT